MDMLELIEVINDMRDEIQCVVQMEDLHPLDISSSDPQEYYYRPNRRPCIEVATMYDKEEILPFLFDKGIFGWEVKSWDIDTDWGLFTRIRIELYRFNCD